MWMWCGTCVIYLLIEVLIHQQEKAKPFAWQHSAAT